MKEPPKINESVAANLCNAKYYVEEFPYEPKIFLFPRNSYL